MGRKKKYENCEIVKGILSRECNTLGDMQGCLAFKFLDMKNKNDRDFLRRNVKDMIDIFNDALEELDKGVN